ncbi:MAG: transglycosylase domain-containing protein [Clostridia bacterium]|nr:transglycosylase domain-containing protein [Clostridia bacterium]
MKTEKKRRGRRIFLALLVTLLALLATAVTAVAVIVALTVDPEADAALFLASRGSRTTRLYYNADRTGQVYAATEWESERLYGAENAIWTEYSDIPENLVNAFLAAEDHRFFRHDGVDWGRTVKAALNQVLHFDERFGGSSITQQLIKNLSGDSEPSAMRKLREIYRAVALERRFSKEEILELYLNIVPMGENSVGVGAGAERYFGKSPSELTDAECAALAAIINAPARYDLIKHGDANRGRREVILGEMKEYGMLSEEEHRAALAEELVPLPHGVSEPGTVYSWYTEAVIDDVLRDLCEVAGYSRPAALRLLYGGGLEIYTLADPKVQAAMERTLGALSVSDGVQYAATVIDPHTGDLLGLVGGAGKKRGNRLLNHATVPHTPGSALKPLSVYAPALEAGLINSATVFDDVPLAFLGEDMRAWPKNSPEVYAGLVDLGTAVATSKNTVAVRVLRRLGKENSYSFLTHTLGLSTLVRRAKDAGGGVLTDLAEAPLALGQLSYGVSLRELTEAYTPLAGDGTYRKGRTYLAVYDNQGKLLLTNESEERPALRRETACIMTKLLEGVVKGGTANGIRLAGGIPVAGKTGTSSEGRDKLFVGYSPYYLCGVWCGSEGGATSIAGRPQLAVFNAVMGELHRSLSMAEDRLTEFPLVRGVYECRFCRDGGGLLTEDCLTDPRGNRVTVGWFTAADLPSSPCTCHVGVLCGEEGGVAAELDGTPLTDAPLGDAKLVRRGLVRTPERRFPVQVLVRDAQYVYRPLGEGRPTAEANAPYFASLFGKGEYVGISPTETGAQFNAAYRPRAAESPFDFYRPLLGGS